MTDTHLSDTKFTALDIHPSVQKGIEDTGFEYCTPIQALALPIALQGKDVSGQAQTGTGKTAAFLIACLNRLLLTEPSKGKGPNPIRALVLAPTRELAIQIFEDGKPLIKHTGLKMGIAYGGTDYEKQRKHIDDGIDLLVGTPGRVIDYFKQSVFSIDALQVIVLDEADRMFDLGFIADIRYLFRRMPDPENRLNLLFSATLSHRVSELAYEHMSEPEVIKIKAEAITADRVEELAYMPSNEEKIPLLMGLLDKAKDEKTVVFINTKHMAETIEAWLNANQFTVALLSGDVPQKKRESLLKKFKDGGCNILVATDVAARGLHIPAVNYVINFDLPTDAEDYVHRIGRTARAGASGTAISLICETYAMSIMDIEEYIEHAIPVEKEIADLLYQDAVKPDLSQLKSNRKFSKDKNRRKSSAAKPNRHNNKPFDNGKPAPTKAKQPVKPHNDSPEAKDAARLAQLEKSQADTEKMVVPRTPLRARNGREIPVIG